MGRGQGGGAAGTPSSGSAFSSFGPCEAWLGDLGSGCSLAASGISQAAFDTGPSPGFGVKSGRQNSPVLQEETEKHHSARYTTGYNVAPTHHISRRLRRGRFRRVSDYNANQTVFVGLADSRSPSPVRTRRQLPIRRFETRRTIHNCPIFPSILERRPGQMEMNSRYTS